MSRLTLGSLFSGSGSFELAGLLHGIESLWASEVEPFPIRVTTKRFPNMLHAGDINTINGATLPPVDIITGGFPCQNLSLAGKRDGLHGERSGLFFQMVRVIREMRQATNNQYPRFVVVENVKGMYSSNGGKDFLEVLNELVKIKDETLSVPMPKSGKWLGAGEIVGDGFSLAYRTLCASGWSVPQRRIRCYLVLDFASERASEILFNESRLSGNPAPCSQQGQGTTRNSTDCIGIPSEQRPLAFEPGAVSRLGGHVWEDMACTLRADMGDNQLSVAIPVENHPSDSRVKLKEDGIVQTLTSRAGTGGNNVPLILSQENPTAYGIASYYSNAMLSENPHAGIYKAETSRTLDTSSTDPNKNAGGIAVVCLEGNADRPSHKGNGISENGICYTLNTVENHKIAYDETAAYTMTTGSYTQVCKEQSPTLQARDFKDAPIVAKQQYVVRRLTPQECAMLQGLPFDYCEGLETPEPTEADITFWTEVFETHRKIIGKSSRPKSRNQIVKWLKNPYSDSAAYKLYGNGIALPCGAFVLGGIAWLTSRKVLEA